MAIFIQPAETIKAYQSIEHLQAQIWGGKAEVVPTHILLTFAKEGGIVQIMYDNATPIGFSFGFPALTESGRLKFASHQAGVLAEYQGRGLGYRLKLAQREAALAKNFELITWTYDPLLLPNARLNVRKLGAVCSTYSPNLYGEMTDNLNRGLPSDRFRVDWWISSNHVKARLSNNNREPEVPVEYTVLNPATLLPDGLLAPAEAIVLPHKDAFCLVEIPANLPQLRARVPDLALRWRLQTRDLFETLFAQGFTVVDLLKRNTRTYYLLQQNWQPNR